MASNMAGLKMLYSTQLTTSSTWRIQLTRRRKTTHVQTDNVGAGVGFPQQMRGDRRVDPARHGHDDSLAIWSVVEDPARRGEHPPSQRGGGRHLAAAAGVAHFREEILWRAAVKVKVAVNVLVPLIYSRFPMARQARSSQKHTKNGTMPPPPTFPAALITDRESNHGGGIIALHDVPVPKPLRRFVAEVNCRMVVSTKMQHIMCFVEAPLDTKIWHIGRSSSKCRMVRGEGGTNTCSRERKRMGIWFDKHNAPTLVFFFFVKTGAISAYLFANT